MVISRAIAMGKPWGVVACVEKCTKGVQMNWSLFFLNQLLDDALVAQGKGPFSYSWLLILIALVTWMEPADYQQMVVDAVKVCCGACYQNLWWVENPS